MTEIWTIFLVCNNIVDVDLSAIHRAADVKDMDVCGRMWGPDQTIPKHARVLGLMPRYGKTICVSSVSAFRGHPESCIKCSEVSS
ncbi:hypothetical protein BD410DRAFT_779311 [Rickenella mellea]|uniref:Uncharacterized protein n=1 Tax=Rickenella mellea TaxID=50990 RepID=A0A4R5XDB6_9AGAM|nr:hypothetical protein BD410DRAFT_779311 [Rickenella mellea]